MAALGLSANVIVALVVLISRVHSQDCLQNTPVYGNKGGGGVPRLENDNLYLIPAYTFSCHGNVTQWKACVERGGESERYTIVFTVYRPSGPALPNCYDLVGSNILADAAPTDSCVTLDVPVDQVSVQPGDVVGVIPMSNKTDNGIEIDISVTRVTTWYTPINNLIIGGVGPCQFRVSDGNLPLSVPLAPVITAVVASSTSSLSPYSSPSPSASLSQATHSSTPYDHSHLPASTQIPDGPLSTAVIAGITVGGVGGVAVLLLLVLLLIVLLWKYHSREGGKALRVLKPLALQNTVFDVKEPVYETTLGSETYYTEIHSQHDETHSNENYIQIHSQHNTTHSNESYEIVAITVPTDTHLETHDNEAYQTTATSDPTQHIEIHGNDTYQTIATADPTQHIETHGNEAYQTTANAISTQQNATYSGQVEDQFDCKENVAYSGQVDYQFDCKENDGYGGQVDNQDHIVPDYQ